jgi:ABC-type polysaccharide/polyol phosphate export permease
MSSRWRELRELTRVRVLLFLREPEALFWVFAFPAILAAVLGFAFRSSEVEPARVLVMPGPGAEALLARLSGRDGLAPELAAGEEEAARALRSGKVDAVVLAGEPPTVRYDPRRAEGEAARVRLALALGLPGDAPPPVRAVAVREKGSRYVDFLFPGLIGMNLMGTGMWVLGFTVADLRQKKILKRMLVTPMRRSSFLLSLILARLVFLVLEVGALLAFAVLALDVPFRASLVAYALLCLLGALTFAGLGLLVTARVKTIQGASGVLNLAMMPMWLLSGVFFSYERFPDALHPVLRLIPLSALNDGLRASMLDGAGLVAIAPQLGILAAWGVLAFAVALRVFRWE